jgi:O-antigen/teichoic acid export membrane protein
LLKGLSERSPKAPSNPHRLGAILNPNSQLRTAVWLKLKTIRKNSIRRRVGNQPVSQSLPLPNDQAATERYERRAKVAGFLLSLATSVGTFFFFAIQGILLARLLGPGQRGAFAAAVLFPQALLYLGLLGASELIAGYAARGLSDIELRRSAARYGAFAGTLSMLVCIALDWLLIPPQLRDYLPLAILCALSLPLQQIRLAVQAVDHGRRNMTRYNQVRLYASAAFPVTLGIGAMFGLSDLHWCCYWFLISQLLACMLIQWGMRGSWFGTGAVPVHTALRDARGLMLAWLSTELLERLDLLLFLLLVANDVTLGFYSAAAPIAGAMIIIPNTMGLYAFNRGARKDEIPNPRDVQRILWAGVAIQIGCAVSLGLLLPTLINICYGKNFSDTVIFAWLLLPAGVFRGLLQAVDSFSRARNKPGLGMRARLFSVPILIAIAYIGYPYLGAHSIPIGLSIAQFVCFVIVAVGVLKDVREHATANNHLEPTT